MPNSEQIKSIIRLLLGAGGPLAALLVSKGVSADQVSIYLELALVIVPPVIAGAWGLLSHSDTGTLKAVASVDGASVKVDTAVATPTVVALAASNDPALSHITEEKP